VDLSFDTPTTSTPQPAPSSNVYVDPFDIFGQTPLKPTASPSPPPVKPTSTFNIPPQPQPSAFKPGMFNGQQPSSKPYVPPTAGFGPGAGFNGGFTGVPPSGVPPGGVPPSGVPPGGAPPRPGYNGTYAGVPPGGVPPGGVPPRPGGFNSYTPPPGNGNPYINPPNPGFFVQQETDGLDTSTAAKLRQWAEKGGKKQNLRALLSTINDVLWPDSGWEPKGLGALVAPNQVKKAYRQATLIVHPDKVANCTDEQKLIAKRIFETLSESYNVFQNEPQ